MPTRPSMKPLYPPDCPHHSASAIARDYLLIVFVLVVPILASCNGVFTISDLWTVRCSEMPSLDEVQKIRLKYDDFFEELQKEGLIWEAGVARRGNCPGRAFIIIYHGGEGKKPLVLAMMDELGARTEGDNYFFGVPFRFMEVKEDDFYAMRRPHHSLT